MKAPQLMDQVRPVVESGDDRESKARRIAELIRNAADYRVPVLDPSTRSALGTIDVESPNVNAFGDADRALLEQCAAVLPPLYTNRPSRERRSQQQRKGP